MRTRAPALAVAILALAAAALPAESSAAAPRYELAGGCYLMRSPSAQRYVARAGRTYAATASVPATAEPFRFKASALGRYLMLGRSGALYASTPAGRIAAAGSATEAADWTVREAGAGRFTLTPRAGGGPARTVSLERAGGCPRFPEAGTSASGSSPAAPSPIGDVYGTVDGHAHISAFEFIGGNFHCGRPWSPMGVAAALPDCASIQGPQGLGAPIQNFLDFGNPVSPHDTVGWPTFKDWPQYSTLTYEQTYYTWVERAWRGGLRLLMNDTVDNAALCDIYPNKRNSCDEMASARIQIKDLYALQDYIDAQSGGPGKGWFRVVTDPFQARRVINQGKLAVVIGMEFSALFGCGQYNDVPQCDRAQIDRQLAEFRGLGVTSFQPLHKFDNAFGGTKMDDGLTGLLVNGGNKLKTGQYWKIQTCGAGVEQDNTQPAGGNAALSAFLAATPVGPLIAPGAVPAYPPPPHCNTRGLTDLGEYALRRLMSSGAIISLDHMDGVTRAGALALLESKRYSGVVSNHSWSTPKSYPRMYALGGFVTPAGDGSTSFIKEWRSVRAGRSPRFYFGYGYGSDVNGLSEMPAPRKGATNPVTYPFKSFDGKVTFNRQQAGQRTFDINRDGVAQYGGYADWFQDIRVQAGDQILREMMRGAEAYLEMWERAQGIPRTSCRSRREPFTVRGIGKFRLGMELRAQLRRAGQPSTRPGYDYRWCVNGSRRAAVTASFDSRGRVRLVASTARGHRSRGVGPGSRARALRRLARRRSGGVYVGRRLRGGVRRVWLVRRGRVRVAGVATAGLVRRRATLARSLRRAAGALPAGSVR